MGCNCTIPARLRVKKKRKENIGEQNWAGSEGWACDGGLCVLLCVAVEYEMVFFSLPKIRIWLFVNGILCKSFKFYFFSKKSWMNLNIKVIFDWIFDVL